MNMIFTFSCGANKPIGHIQFFEKHQVVKAVPTLHCTGQSCRVRTSVPWTGCAEVVPSTPSESLSALCVKLWVNTHRISLHLRFLLQKARGEGNYNNVGPIVMYVLYNALA